MLTKSDIKAIEEIIARAVTPLATKTDVASLDTRLTRFEVNMTRQFAGLKNKTTKDVEKLEKAIKTEYKRGNEDFGYIENHLGFAVLNAP